MARRPDNNAPASPADFLRRLEAFAAGSGSLGELREQLRAILATDPRHASLLRTLIERAREEGRLPAPVAAALLRPATEAQSEDLPTAWSEEVASTRHFPAAADAPATVGGTGLGPGAVLNNRFVLYDRLGGGGMAEVFKALDRRREEAGQESPWVVLKVACTRTGDPRAVQALQREGRIATRLSHPNVIRMFDLDRDGDHVFLTMEWLDGDPLARLLDQRRDRPWPRLQALPLIEGLCRGLAHAHGEGLVHGDIKPANLFVTTDGRLKILDFGVARDLRDGNATPPAGFTPEYASPELLAGAAAEPADDVYAAACVAYRLLAGQRPWGGATAADAAAAGWQPAMPDSLSPSQWRALARGLAFTRAGRPETTSQFLAEFKGPREDPRPVAGDPLAGRALAPVTIRAGALAGLAIAIGAALVLFREPVGDAPVAVAGQVTARDAPPAGPGERFASRLAPAAVAGTPTAGMARASAPPAPAAATAVPRMAAQRRRDAMPVAAAGNGGASTTPSATLARSPRQEPAVGAPESAAGGAPALPVPVPPAAATRVATADDPAMRPALVPGAGSAGGEATGARAGSPGTGDGSAGAGEVPLSTLDLRRYVEADYPRTAAARREAGWVEVAFTVDDKGRPRDLRVAAADPPGRFDAAAVSAVRRWRFAPPVAGSLPRSRVRVRFSPESRD